MQYSRSRGHKCTMHVDVVFEVNQIGKVTVLAEELRKGDQRTRRGGIRLVRRPEDHNDIPTAVRMKSIRAVYVAQLLFLVNSQDDLLESGQVRVIQVCEVVDQIISN